MVNILGYPDYTLVGGGNPLEDRNDVMVHTALARACPGGKTSTVICHRVNCDTCRPVLCKSPLTECPTCGGRKWQPDPRPGLNFHRGYTKICSCGSILVVCDGVITAASVPEPFAAMVEGRDDVI